MITGSISLRCICLLVLLGVGCGAVRPCETTRQCDAGDVCAAGRCQELSCGQSLFLKDPTNGSCVPLSGCFLTDEQRDWPSCDAADPCSALAEGTCLAAARCQPIYALDKSGDAVHRSCHPNLMERPMGVSLINQNRALHPPMICNDPTQRVYAGCRLVPELPEPCSALDEPLCAMRADCEWGKATIMGGRSTTPVCAERRQMRSPECYFSSSDRGEEEVACLLNPRCQATGTACYCPPGATCPCSGGTFVGCEYNDRMLRCTSDGDCASAQTCRPRPDCPATRTGLLDANPYSSPCAGVCARDACDGLDEGSCSSREDCAAIYGTECTANRFAAYVDCPLNPAGSVVVGCTCSGVFQRCAERRPIVENGVTIRSERSLLVRDPAIVSDDKFRLDNVLTSFARPGDEATFINIWLSRFYLDQMLPSGAKAARRKNFSTIFREVPGSSSSNWFTSRWHTTALINRIDLMKPGSCGEARIAFAYNGGWSQSNERMTIIVELKVPDDGQRCKQAAARWLELSAIDDPKERLSRLQALYGALLQPQYLSQVRTNEFVSPFGEDPWELREWHLDRGELVLAPARQAVDIRTSGSSELASWVKENLAAINDGTIEVDDLFQAAAVPSDGRMLRVPGSRTDSTMRAAETALNKLSCSGCHVGATGSPFVHIGERLAEAKLLSPSGPAVVSEFLLSELPGRAAILAAVWQGRASLQALQRAASLRVH